MFLKKLNANLKKISQKVAPKPLNIDRLMLNRLFHQTPDLPEKNNSK